ncbi:MULTISPECIES: hypothetical protein [Streptomyces]|uniref:Uncharacterized protein n=1 Tax=Streptomyces tsukubensis (strain DSM 42081 / NBRC 108919 / NRRL 18488 / 9993) TaxID=1114943 RepID=I2N0W4_STRT9|nr:MULTISPECIES: hypothetical protein [Streptomyces]AZK94854.1 hypothetical protein B7R87_13990 [Streptomyces tsukubensis]EIF90661.1 hypothetical protein [Streptomyces tsukubensis NRRL18488]MYS66976.1 hypothetical protein [Streptomyces sp. SID5473]QKM69064.1 hypothetical protein STSU_019780 [Streptomyces tsukubensis NRRL18488]TAI40714.1 hypothetical protein EWI31_30455 [Streptomyces tsukubensis]
MGFMRKAAESARAAVQSGQPEKAADIVHYAAMEGSGTYDENMAALARAAKETNPKRTKA